MTQLLVCATHTISFIEKSIEAGILLRYVKFQISTPQIKWLSQTNFRIVFLEKLECFTVIDKAGSSVGSWYRASTMIALFASAMASSGSKLAFTWFEWRISVVMLSLKHSKYCPTAMRVCCVTRYPELSCGACRAERSACNQALHSGKPCSALQASDSPCVQNDIDKIASLKLMIKPLLEEQQRQVSCVGAGRNRTHAVQVGVAGHRFCLSPTTQRGRQNDINVLTRILGHKPWKGIKLHTHRQSRWTCLQSRGSRRRSLQQERFVRMKAIHCHRWLDTNQPRSSFGVNYGFQKRWTPHYKSKNKIGIDSEKAISRIACGYA